MTSLPQRKIDIHTHLLPPESPAWAGKFGYPGFVSWQASGGCARLVREDGSLFREVAANCFDAEVRLRECDSEGVTQQVLSTVPVLFHYWAKPADALTTAKFLNDHLAETVHRYPRRFFGLATVPMQDPQLACQELTRAVKELKLCGIQIGTHVNGANLDDPGVFEVLKAASDLGACVFVHPWDMLAPERLKKYWMPWLVGMPAELSVAMASLAFGGVLEKLPDLRIAFAHGGGSSAALLGRWERGFTARPDLCQTATHTMPRAHLQRVYVDTLVHDARVLELLQSVFGEDRLCLGSDYPFPLGESPVGELIESMPWSAGAKEKVRYRNALQWLGVALDA